MATETASMLKSLSLNVSQLRDFIGSPLDMNIEIYKTLLEMILFQLFGGRQGKGLKHRRTERNKITSCFCFFTCRKRNEAEKTAINNKYI